MTPHRILVTLVLLLALVTRGTAQQRDLRDQYGTKSLKAAKHIAEAIRLATAKKHAEALPAVRAALKADPRCQMAHFWHGIILRNLGEIPECIAAYKKALADDIPRGSNISAMAAQSLGDIHAKLGENDDANVWFTRAVLEDTGNRSKQRGLAYRNLSVTLGRQGKHLAAALALAMALKDKTTGVTEEQVGNLYEKGEEQEAATLLYFPGKTPEAAKRGQDTRLTAVALGADIAEPISDILADPQGRYLVALARTAPHYYLVGLGGKPAVTKVALKGPPMCACLAEGFLYLAANNPARIDQVEPVGGKVVKTYLLKNFVPGSMAVFPHPVLNPDGLGAAVGGVYFPLGDSIHLLDFLNGRLVKTDIPGDVVVGHPGQRFLFSYMKSQRTRWRQTTLVKSVIIPGGLTMAGLRVNAASNAFRMQVSPDGNWVAVAGGGGWRPSARQKGGGYGVAVFSAHDPGYMQGYFEIGAYPLGVCFNPVTAQVTVLRAQDAKVYHLSDPRAAVEVKGPFNGVGAWSGNGKFLALANSAKGLSLWENTLTAAEAGRASTWWKDLVVKVRIGRSVTFRPVEALTRFTLKKPSRKELAGALARLATEGRTDRPPRWQEYPIYVKKAEVRQAVAAAGELLRQGTDFGIAIFQIKKALKAHPDAVPLKFFLAEALRRGDQPREAEKLYLDVVRSDAGRTELSSAALNNLAALLRQDQAMSALDCLAASLALDRGNPNTLALTIELLKKQKFDAEADALTKLAKALPVTSGGASALPKLARPAANGKKYDAEEIYTKAAPSVVLIKMRNSSGSGVCVGKAEFILTNYHVIKGEGPILVTPFTYKDAKLVRLPAVRAEIVFQSPEDDVAVLKLDKAPMHLVPLEVAAANPVAGSRVYALGSPGLGKEILEQSISEGIVSAARRMIENRPYLQHTAAVNPGNSGGPLIDEKCRLVGIVTLKAKLDKVSFAIPVGRLREIFKSP